MKKLLPLAFILTFTFGVYSTPTTMTGLVPFESSPNTYSPTEMRYNDDGSLKTFNFFDFYFGSNGRFELGTSTRYAIVADGNLENGSMVIGDWQDLRNSTKQIINDDTHAITMQANVMLPELPNCAALGTDSDGKVICVQQMLSAVPSKYLPISRRPRLN